MPAKPCSIKTFNSRMKRSTDELKRLARQDVNAQIRPAHLDMTDEEIDAAYFHMGKTSRNILKREARNERERKSVNQTLTLEG